MFEEKKKKKNVGVNSTCIEKLLNYLPRIFGYIEMERKREKK